MQAGTISISFKTVFALHEVRFFSFRFLIISYKKLYRNQPVEILIIEHIKKKSDLSFLKSNFLKAGLYCIQGVYLIRFKCRKPVLLCLTNAISNKNFEHKLRSVKSIPMFFVMFLKALSDDQIHSMHYQIFPLKY